MAKDKKDEKVTSSYRAKKALIQAAKKQAKKEKTTLSAVVESKLLEYVEKY